MRKLLPYAVVAKNALINWNGKSEEEADKIARYENYDQIEEKFGINVPTKTEKDFVLNSFMAAIEKISEIANLSGERKKEFIECSLGKHVMPFAKEYDENHYEGLLYDNVHKRWEEEVSKNANAVIAVLVAVHDQWLKDNVSKFNKPGREDRRFQHLPLELIGWKEVKKDLLFVEPILDAIGVHVSEEELEKAYNRKVNLFFEDNKLNTPEDLKNYILNVDKHYPIISQENSTKDETIANEMVNQVVDKLGLDTKAMEDKHNAEMSDRKLK